MFKKTFSVLMLIAGLISIWMGLGKSQKIDLQRAEDIVTAGQPRPSIGC